MSIVNIGTPYRKCDSCNVRKWNASDSVYVNGNSSVWTKSQNSRLCRNYN